MFIVMYLLMKLIGIWGLIITPFILLIFNSIKQKGNIQKIKKIIKKSL